MAPGAWDHWVAFAAADPDRTAVVAGADRRTFAALVADAGDLGAWLVDEGAARPGRVVAVAAGPELELLVSLGGLLAVGAVPVVVDERLSADELHRVVDSTDATAVLHRGASEEIVQRAVKRIQRQWRPVCVDLGTRPATADDGGDASASGRPPDGAPGAVVLVGPGPGSTDTVASIDTAAFDEVTVGDGAHLVLTPLARGPGLVSALATLGTGHPLVLAAPVWTVDDVLAAVEREHVTRVTVDAGHREWGRAVAEAFPHVGVVVVTGTADEADAPGGTRARPTIDLPEGSVDVGHVEARIASHRGVATCRVVALATRSGPPALIGLVVTRDGHYLDAAELRAWARRKLAAHATPRAWLIVDALDPAATDEELRALAIDNLRVP